MRCEGSDHVLMERTLWWGGICPTMGDSPDYQPETKWLDEVAEALVEWDRR